MKANYLPQIPSTKETTPDVQKAMSDIKKYSEQLSGVSTDDLKDINELMDKVDGLSDVFDKYAKLKSKVEKLKENAALIESAVGELSEAAKTSEVEVIPGCTLDETYKINMQLIKEFEFGSRISKDLLDLSKSQKLDEAVPDEVPSYAGLTKEQTVQVYMQVIEEFEKSTQIAQTLQYNAGV